MMYEYVGGCTVTLFQLAMLLETLSMITAVCYDRFTNEGLTHRVTQYTPT